MQARYACWLTAVLLMSCRRRCTGASTSSGGSCGAVCEPGFIGASTRIVSCFNGIWQPSQGTITCETGAALTWPYCTLMCIYTCIMYINLSPVIASGVADNMPMPRAVCLHVCLHACMRSNQRCVIHIHACLPVHLQHLFSLPLYIPFY
jgi:hypothetical protein